MEKLDLKKQFAAQYKPGKKPALVEIPKFNYLMLDGQGDPNESELFGSAVEALYSLSYTIKFMIKKGEMAIDYGVMPLEGLWWVADMTQFSIEDKSNWQWTVMIMQPKFINDEVVETARQQAFVKKGLPLLHEIRFESFAEGKTAQIMHLGPFSDEGPTIETLHTFIECEGLKRRAKHHEIYLSDIRRAAPEKWKTIIRQPVK